MVAGPVSRWTQGTKVSGPCFPLPSAAFPEGFAAAPSLPARPARWWSAGLIMAKSKNHTTHNQSRKWHRNGIKKPRSQRYESLKGVTISLFIILLSGSAVLHMSCRHPASVLAHLLSSPLVENGCLIS
ncbi:unnamed protein product [Caretta caretta]